MGGPSGPLALVMNQQSHQKGNVMGKYVDLEKRAAYMKKWREEHREEINKAHKAWEDAHREKVSARQRKGREEHYDIRHQQDMKSCRKRRLQARLTAFNHYQPWTEAEMLAIIAPDRPADKILAAQLGRTLSAIACKRRQLNREKG
jgi:hypothetical protein